MTVDEFYKQLKYWLNIDNDIDEPKIKMMIESYGSHALNFINVKSNNENLEKMLNNASVRLALYKFIKNDYNETSKPDPEDSYFYLYSSLKEIKNEFKD